jgi:hypothetical protein
MLYPGLNTLVFDKHSSLLLKFVNNRKKIVNCTLYIHLKMLNPILNTLVFLQTL